MPAFRRSPYPVWLGVFALLVQLMLPNAHAQSWARENGAPLLFAFCGQLSPGLLARLRESTPPELWTSAGTADDSVPPACPLCKAVHGGHLAGKSHSFAMLLVASPALPLPSEETRAPNGEPFNSRQPRGPPA